MSEDERLITITTKDGKKFSVNYKWVEKSKVLVDMATSGVDFQGGQEVPLSVVDSETLEKLLEWLKYHTENALGEEASVAEKEKHEMEMGAWNNLYLERLGHKMMFHVVEAANYLDIPDLLKLCSDKVMVMIKNKTPDEIRLMLGIKNDFTPKEEAQIRKEMSWREKKPEEEDFL